MLWGKWTPHFMRNSLIMAEAEAICLTCLISRMIPVPMVPTHSYPSFIAWKHTSIENLNYLFTRFFNLLPAWDYSAWVRTYALFLEERLECFRVLKYDVETDRPVRNLFLFYRLFWHMISCIFVLGKQSWLPFWISYFWKTRIARGLKIEKILSLGPSCFLPLSFHPPSCVLFLSSSS